MAAFGGGGRDGASENAGSPGYGDVHSPRLRPTAAYENEAPGCRKNLDGLAAYA